MLDRADRTAAYAATRIETLATAIHEDLEGHQRAGGTTPGATADVPSDQLAEACRESNCSKSFDVIRKVTALGRIAEPKGRSSELAPLVRSTAPGVPASGRRLGSAGPRP